MYACVLCFCAGLNMGLWQPVRQVAVITESIRRIRVLFLVRLAQELIILKNINNMEMITIIPSESKLWEQAWRLYTESFPEHERRRISSHVLAVEDPHFHTGVAVENGHLLAILFYWTAGENKVYIEHIAVNPLMRGQNVGSTILRNFMAQNPDATIILEIDPPADDISQRRLSFYERAGFHNTGFVYDHPSYQKKGMHHDLLVLSYPRNISREECEQFVGFMHDEPLKYID